MYLIIFRIILALFTNDKIFFQIVLLVACSCASVSPKGREDDVQQIKNVKLIFMNHLGEYRTI